MLSQRIYAWPVELIFQWQRGRRLLCREASNGVKVFWSEDFSSNPVGNIAKMSRP